jgi:hypothetical protein
MIRSLPVAFFNASAPRHPALGPLSSSSGISQMTNPTKVTRSRFEIEQDGKTSYLEFETDDQGWLTLIHTEVPVAQRGRGLAQELVTTAFQFAKDNNLKVDVICPIAQHVVSTHPEFQPLVQKR